MTNDQIKELALAYGFKLKEQPNGEMDLNPYVYDFARAIGSTQNCINIVKQHSQETCNWRNNKGTGLWECHYGGDYTSDCGLEWNMSNKDSPSENEMHFCPKCGKKLVEVQPPSEVQDG